MKLNILLFMKIPQKLKTYAESNDLILVPITYTFQGYRCKGWDICKSNGQIMFGIEPAWYSNGDRWMVLHHHENYEGLKYFKRISNAMFKDIDLTQNSYIYNKTLIKNG